MVWEFIVKVTLGILIVVVLYVMQVHLPAEAEQFSQTECLSVELETQ
jgi:hypothetical protein